MSRILHITPHLGGGVGKVLLNHIVADKHHCHTVVSLDSANPMAIRCAEENMFTLFSNGWQNIPHILDAVSLSDIVVIHFWNHPLLYDLLINHTFPPARIALWSHISGIAPPYVFPASILRYPDCFIFTTAGSLSIVHRAINQKYRIIRSTGGVEPVRFLTPIPHEGCVMGYIGTVDFAKMHPQYVEVHKNLQLENVRFLIVGGDDEKNISGAADSRFTFTGNVTDIRPYLAQMDIFSYLLNESHYGTAEQSLQEAMAAGVVPVVLNNIAETHLVQHKKTGLIANNLYEYQQYITLLYEDTQLRKTLAANAKIYAEQEFSLNAMIDAWNDVYSHLLSLPKQARNYGLKGPLSPHELFLESLGEHKNLFEDKPDSFIRKALRNSVWQSASKGTPKHYATFFPEDKNLQRVVNLYE